MHLIRMKHGILLIFQRENIVDLTKGKHIVGCKWVCMVKYNPDGTKYKERIAAESVRSQPFPSFIYGNYVCLCDSEDI